MLTQKATAWSLIGGTIYFTHIRGDSIKVYVDVYYACGTNPVYDTIAIYIKPENSSEVKYLASLTKKSALSRYTPGVCNNCTNSSCINSPDNQKWTFEAVIDFADYTGCDFHIYKKQEGDVYLETNFNRCISGYFNSPVFAKDVAWYYVLGNCYKQYESVYHDKDDSVVYFLVEPKIDGFTYPAGHSYLKPLPITTSGNCAGFNFDKFTGEIFFEPVPYGTASAMAVKAEIYRKDSSGKMQKLCEITRSQRFGSLLYTNKQPAILNSTKQYSVCVGDELYIFFRSSDDDTNDSTFLFASTNALGSEFTPTTHLKRNTAIFKWSPKEEDIHSKPYKLYLTVKDNKTYFDHNEIAIDIHVIGKKSELELSRQDTGCGYYAYKVNGDTVDIINYSWVYQGKEFSKQKNAVLKVYGNGTHVVTLTAFNKNGCKTVVVDTIEHTGFPDLVLTNDTSICPGDFLQIKTN